MALSLKSTIAEIMMNPEAVKALNAINPGIAGHPMLSAAMGMSVNECALYAPDVLTKEVLEKIAEVFAKLEG